LIEEVWVGVWEWSKVRMENKNKQGNSFRPQFWSGDFSRHHHQRNLIPTDIQLVMVQSARHTF